MEAVASHQLDTSVDIDREINSLAVRDQLVLRTAIPPVVPRLNESLLSMAHQTTIRSAPHAMASDICAAESYLVMDANHAVKKLQRWRHLMPRVKPFFAIKCNPDPVLIKSLVVAGDCGFDCASIGEIGAVLEAGAHPARIIYANPNKAPDAITRSLMLGVTTMTFDSVAELRKIRDAVNLLREQHGPDAPVPDMVLRLRVPDDHSVFKLGSKFGAEPLQVRSLLQASLDTGLRVVGISFHCGSGCYDATAFVVALRLARDAFNIGAEMGIVMTLVDMGGGFPGLDGDEEVTDDESDEPTEDLPATVFSGIPAPGTSSEQGEKLCLRKDMSKFKGELHLVEVARQVKPALDELFPVDGPPVSVISEPGRYFVEGSTELFLNVFESKDLPLGQKVSSSALVSASEASDGSTTETSEVENNEAVTLWFVNEGTLGCFKDIVLSDVKFEPELVLHADLESVVESSPRSQRSRSTSQADVDGVHRARGYSEISLQAVPETTPDAENSASPSGIITKRRHVLVGVEGTAMTVLHERLPFVPYEGCWIRFKRFGAYTNSLASTDISQAKSRKCYFWCLN